MARTWKINWKLGFKSDLWGLLFPKSGVLFWRVPVILVPLGDSVFGDYKI